MSTYNFKNLAIKGGWIRGIAYLGALETLIKQKALSNVQNIAGASAGAITALVTAMYLINPKYKDDPFERIKSVANSLDFKKVGICSIQLLY